MPEKKAITKIKKANTKPLLNLLSKINVVWILVLLLIIASFLLGVLFTKVQYLEKVGSSIPSANDEFLEDNQASAPTGPVDVGVGGLPPLGNEDAPVTLIEFSDFECPFCSSLFNDILPQIKKDYIDTGVVKLYYRHFPLTSIHPNAQKAAEASECANDQGRFWNYHDALFENQEEWAPLQADKAEEKFIEYATTLGFSINEFQDCLSSEKFADNVGKDVEEGIQAGVDGTPAIFINGYLTVGAVPYEQFKTEIDARLEE